MSRDLEGSLVAESLAASDRDAAAAVVQPQVVQPQEQGAVKAELHRLQLESGPQHEFSVGDPA